MSCFLSNRRSELDVEHPHHVHEQEEAQEHGQRDRQPDEEREDPLLLVQQPAVGVVEQQTHRGPGATAQQGQAWGGVQVCRGAEQEAHCGSTFEEKKIMLKNQKVNFSVWYSEINKFGEKNINLLYLKLQIDRQLTKSYT